MCSLVALGNAEHVHYCTSFLRCIRFTFLTVRPFARSPTRLPQVEKVRLGRGRTRRGLPLNLRRARREVAAREAAILNMRGFAVRCRLQNDCQGAGRAQEGARPGRAPHPALGAVPATRHQPRDGPHRGAGQGQPRARRAQRPHAAAHHARVDQVRAEPLRRLRHASVARRLALLPRLLHTGRYPCSRLECFIAGGNSKRSAFGQLF